MVRKYLSKDNYSKGYAQYNAIMLTRILADNPARPFTQNFDKSFISTTKELLREGKDLSVQQILRETLDYMEAEKLKTNDSLTPLVEMWRKEKSKTARIYGNFAVSVDLWNTMGDADNHDQNQRRTSQAYNGQYQANPHSRRHHGLPPPDELVSRIEEAKTTARLLLQTIQSTPSSEVLSNDLIKEFADRAKSAHRSIQGYMNSEDPRPDEDTMLTLIETSDQLNIAMSKHQRALLQARKAMGQDTTSPPPQTNASPPPQTQYSQPQPQRAYSGGYNTTAPQQGSGGNFSPPPGPPPNARGAVRSHDYGYNSAPIDQNRQTSPPTTQTAHYGVADNPFSDDATLPPPPPPQKTYNLFDNSYQSSQPQSGYEQQQQPQQQQTDSTYTQSQRPAGGWGGTQSYMNRQESATNNLTMHGASPPPEGRI